MTYNLGEAGLAGFYDFNALMKSGQWDAAADDLSSTLWCSQVHGRCPRNQALIRSCDSSNAIHNSTGGIDLFSELINDFVLN